MEKNEAVQVNQIQIKEEMEYTGITLLIVTIQYPQLVSNNFPFAIHKINRYYERKAMQFQYHCQKELFTMAIDDYHYSTENGYPIHTYEAVLDYTVTYNENQMISVYFDQYEYTGGAHGNTIRSSQSWNLKSGERYKLSDFFLSNTDYRGYIIQNINDQIKKQIENGTNTYFDNYETLVAQYFNENNFFIEKNGIVIYYQQYDIAPYVAGIVTFIIPS